MSITSLTCFLGSITTVGLKNNDVVSDKKQCKNSINENEIITKKIDAKLIGADKGTITIEYTNPSECKITDCSWSFLASGDFNFNGGKFVYDGVEYIITGIGPDAFRVCDNWHFINCNLTIPSAIKKFMIMLFITILLIVYLLIKKLLALISKKGLNTLVDLLLNIVLV